MVKTTPQDAWNTMRKFWTDIGFVLAVEQPTLGIMETDWAENRVGLPSTVIEGMIGKVADVFFNSYKRDKFRTRLEQGTEPGTVDIYISHRGAEQVPTTLIDNRSPAAFVWAVTPPDPGPRSRDARPRDGALRIAGAGGDGGSAGVDDHARAGARAPRAGGERKLSSSSSTTASTGRGAAWDSRSTASASPSSTAIARRAPISSAMPTPRATAPRRTRGSSTSSCSGRPTLPKVEQYRITVAEASPRSLVTVQDPNGAPDKSATGEKILSLLRDQLK